MIFTDWAYTETHSVSHTVSYVSIFLTNSVLTLKCTSNMSKTNQRVISFFCPSLRTVSSRPFLRWWVSTVPALSTGLLPARTRPSPLLSLWRKPHDQVWRISLFQGLWRQRWGLVCACLSLSVNLHLFTSSVWTVPMLLLCIYLLTLHSLLEVLVRVPCTWNRVMIKTSKQGLLLHIYSCSVLQAW